ncbi:unnamed protein product [Thlaspi arvense]|uniref:Uncharacterized protein n=1 Tax=Thlaspi arvense TaxID=13288 RepID=A0AAU9T3V2_THLAR|nr:unnamed protein product [Thlaspi arvense]
MKGTETVVGIHFDTSDINEPIFLDEKSFVGMPNLQFPEVYLPEAKDRLKLPQGLLYLPPGLRLLSWPQYPSKCLPFTFKAEFVVEISMRESKIEKLWDGTQIWPRTSRNVIGGKQDA